MTSCDEFEVAIEMKLHGALGAADAAALEHHLASCASCRSFENLSKQTERAMTSEAASQAQTIDWEALRDRIKITLKEDSSRALRTGGIIALLMLPAVLLMNQSPSDALISIALTWAIVFATLWFRNHRRIQEIGDAQEDRGEFLYRYRRDLEKRLKVAQAGLVVPLLPALLLGKHYLHMDRVPPIQFWAFVALVMVAAGVGIYSFFVRRPHVKRQLEALKR